MNCVEYKASMFAVGAGKIGNYEQCSFETLGTGQFKPLTQAHPFVGIIGEVLKVKELKVEMLCEDHCLKNIILAMKEHHPYEMPAFEVIQLIDFS